jgi:hypothetical protein
MDFIGRSCQLHSGQKVYSVRAPFKELSMRSSLLRRALQAVAGGLIPGLVSAAALSWVPSSTALVRGHIAYVELRISGLTDDTVWRYAVDVGFDPAIIQLGPIQWGSAVLGDQLSCPGPTPATCTHIGSNIGLDWNADRSHFYFTESSNLEHLTQPMDQLNQADDFVVLRLGFLGLSEGSTSLTANLSYGPWPPGSAEKTLPAASTEIDVLAPEPASWLLGLAGLSALGLQRRAHHLVKS